MQVSHDVVISSLTTTLHLMLVFARIYIGAVIMCVKISNVIIVHYWLIVIF